MLAERRGVGVERRRGASLVVGADAELPLRVVVRTLPTRCCRPRAPSVEYVRRGRPPRQRRRRRHARGRRRRRRCRRRRRRRRRAPRCDRALGRGVVEQPHALVASRSRLRGRRAAARHAGMHRHPAASAAARTASAALAVAEADVERVGEREARRARCPPRPSWPLRLRGEFIKPPERAVVAAERELRRAAPAAATLGAAEDARGRSRATERRRGRAGDPGLAPSAVEARRRRLLDGGGGLRPMTPAHAQPPRAPPGPQRARGAWRFPLGAPSARCGAERAGVAGAPAAAGSWGR